MARTHTPSSSLKLYAEQPPAPERPATEAVASLPALLRAFQRATGWSLQYVAKPAPSHPGGQQGTIPVTSGSAEPCGHFRLTPGASALDVPPGPDLADPMPRRLQPLDDLPPKPRADRPSAKALASAVADMLGDLLEVRRALREREADLAAGVPLVSHADEPQHLAERLEAVLRGGAQAVGCQAAALYLLDEATSVLKLRACWGLPWDRLTAPARPLQGAVADLEALLGHAVVLADPELMRQWHVPEDFAAAVCLPVSSPTSILGTLWVFCGEKRDFNDRETNLLEIVAGRIAAELEREMLRNEALAAAQLRPQLLAAERLQRSQLPTIAPLLDGWDVAGWTAQGGPLGGDFHDWFCLPDGLLAVAVGHAMDQGIEAALAAAALKAALRAHGQYYREAQQTLKRLNLTLWTGSAGDQHATLFYGLLETATGRISSASAGQPGALLVRRDGWQSLSRASAPLGQSPESPYEQFGYELVPGEVLVLLGEGARDAADAAGRPLGESGVAEILQGHLDLSAAELVALVRRRLEDLPAASHRDRTVLVIKRRPQGPAAR
ncbi:MAG: SpoIIE family protein phosphatase [Thermoguttaceae bacterium]